MTLADMLADLHGKRDEAIKAIEKLDAERRMWQKVVEIYDRNIAEIAGAVDLTSASTASSASSKHTYRPRALAHAAMQAIHDKLNHERGRRFSAGELDAVASGFKVRQLIARWNKHIQQKPKSGHAIHVDGEGKGRVYWIGKK